MGNGLLLVLPILGGLALVAVTPSLLARHRRRRRTRATLAWIRSLALETDQVQPGSSQPSPEPPSEAEAGQGPAPVVPISAESLAMRALRSQVRTLEEALEEEQRQHAAPSLDDLETYRRQVHAVIRAMGGKADAEATPAQVLARVSAAVDRLAPTVSFDRPVLTAGAQRASAAPGTALLERTVVEPAAQSRIAGAPADRAAGAAHLDMVETVDMQAAPAASEVESQEPEVVLPVPPMAESGESRRGRRWFRGSAA